MLMSTLIAALNNKTLFSFGTGQKKSFDRVIFITLRNIFYFILFLCNTALTIYNDHIYVTNVAKFK
jgi:hypothetical protein